MEWSGHTTIPLPFENVQEWAAFAAAMGDREERGADAALFFLLFERQRIAEQL
jgi:hypothetical protein